MINKIKDFGLANSITVLRIFLIPIFLLILLMPDYGFFPFAPGFIEAWRPIIAALFFAFIALTDFVDGYVARIRNEVTVFGKLIDPLADKLLVSAALLALVQLGSIEAWTAFVVISREFIVSGLRMVASAEGVVVAASAWGKLKTFLQISSITLLIAFNTSLISALSTQTHSIMYYLIHGLWWLAIAVTIGSMVDYFYKTSSFINRSWKS